jgi:hypothetical protein
VPITPTPDEWAPIIDDPLSWQRGIDVMRVGPNMRGSARFWATVEARGLSVVYQDGVPDFTRIVLDLGDGIGLELSTEDDTPYIRYRFVPLESLT